MRIIEIPFLVYLFITVASSASNADIPSRSSENPDLTTEVDQIPSTAISNKTGGLDEIQAQNLRENAENDLVPSTDVTMDDILFYESLINDDKIVKENKRNFISLTGNSNKKFDNIDSLSENPVESKINNEFIPIRRQEEETPKFKLTDPDSDYDDSRQEKTIPPPPRKSKQRFQDEPPVFRLTQGGYFRPFKPRYRNRYLPRPDSSEQSSQIQEPDRNSNDNRPSSPPTERVVPRVTYSPSMQPPFAFGPQPLLNPPFSAAPRNVISIRRVMPSTIPNTFFNPPPTGLETDYTTVPFQAQFSQNNEISGLPDFMRDPSNAALYQTSRNNPFQAPGIFVQTPPEFKTQPILMDGTGTGPPQFQTNPFSPYPRYENVEDSSRPNYAMFFRNPATNNPFEISSNIYSTPQNAIGSFNSPPLSFLSNFPQSDTALPPRFLRYPVAPEPQNNQARSSNQEADKETSRKEKDAKVEELETVIPTNRNDPPVRTFGTRLQSKYDADVYMRYPTNKAGYAIEENLPNQNNSNGRNDNSQEANSQQRNYPGIERFGNALNSVGSGQSVNNSFEFPPEFFKNVPPDFGYQRSQDQIFTQFPDINQAVGRYPIPNFETRGTFEPIVSLPENSYQFLNLDNQRGLHREVDGTPSCAKQNNASICFEDNEYPGNDVLYSLNSNTFLADRLSVQQMPPNSDVFVERNNNATLSSDQARTAEENYACASDTKFGSPLRAKNLAGTWTIIVNVQGKFAQPVRMEICKSLGDPCSYVDSRVKTTCVQKYSLQRLLSWKPGRGIYSDIFKIPVACSCQILQAAET